MKFLINQIRYVNEKERWEDILCQYKASRSMKMKVCKKLRKLMKQKKTLIIEIKEDPTEDVVRAERRNL